MIPASPSELGHWGAILVPIVSAILALLGTLSARYFAIREKAADMEFRKVEMSNSKELELLRLQLELERERKTAAKLNDTKDG